MVFWGGVARMLDCRMPVKPPARFVAYSTVKYSPVALLHVRATEPGWALGWMFKGRPALDPSPVTRTGRHRSIIVPSPHWPWSFAPHCQTEPSDLMAILCQSLAATITILLKPAP